MLFVSLEFLLFFTVVFVVYWSIGGSSLRLRKLILVASGLVFYGRVDLWFMGLLLASASLNFGLGRFIASTAEGIRRSIYFWIGIVVNVGLLGYFKYFEFFVNSFIDLLSLAGHSYEHLFLSIALPLGISFYTFQMAGYLIDVRNEEIEPVKDPLDFLAYVLFFPKLLAGPVERIQHFMPWITTLRRFDVRMAIDGCRQFLWGMFMKVVLAESCSEFVDAIFKDHASQSGSTVLLGACLYLIQLYCDFAGYSNMAIGTGKLLGIPMRPNFNYPLFATTVSDFWRRWHMSLTSWMMDYLFTPLSFILRRRGRWGTMISITVTFMVVGIWHGANWTFVLFGAVQSLLFVPLVLGDSIQRQPAGAASPLPHPLTILKMLGVFLLMAIAFLLLRADSLAQATSMWQKLLSSSLFSAPDYRPFWLLSGIGVFLVWEWIMRNQEHGLAFGTRFSKPARYAIYYGLVALIGSNLNVQNEFIYFQF